MTGEPAGTVERLDHDGARALFERFYTILNEHDVAQLPAVFTQDVVFEDDAWPERVDGLGAMERFLTSIWRAVPDFRFELVDGPFLGADGRRVAARVRVDGIVTGVLDPPGFAPTGSRVSTEYAGFYEIEGERISRGRVIVNMNDVAIQIGAAPAAGSVGERVAVKLQQLNARRLRKRGGA